MTSTGQSGPLGARNPSHCSCPALSSVMSFIPVSVFAFFFLKILFVCFERGEGRGKEGEKHQCASQVPPTEDLARNPGMCPDWEPNLPPFGSQASAQSTKLRQPGPKLVLNYVPST